MCDVALLVRARKLCLPGVVGASCVEVEPCICIAHQTNSIHIPVHDRMSYLLSSIRMVSILYSLFQEYRQGSFVGSTLPVL